MTSLSRRDVLKLPMAAAVGRFQPSRPQWGVQLYTVRALLAKDPAATLERLAAIGYKELEIIQPTLDVVAPIAKKLGLSMVSVHLDAPTAKGEGLSALVSRAKALGVRNIVMPFVPPADRPADRAGFVQLARRWSGMAADVRSAGLQFSYHNHAFEFATDKDGTPWLDLIMQETAASGMKLELDVFWAAITGADPVAILRKYSGRVALVHLKDKDPKAPVALTESVVAPGSFVEVGSGALDFKAILDAARTAGVEHYFVEQDATPGDAVDSLKKSFSYLTRLGA